MKKLIALLTLCTLMAGCTVAGMEAPSIDWDLLSEHPPFDYFTVSYYDSMRSRIYAEDNEINYFLADELYLLLHRGAGTASAGGWNHTDSDWTLFENISRLNADRPVFKTALEVPDPTEDYQWELVKNETPWVKFVWSENCRVSAEGDVYALEDYMAPGDTVQTIRYIAVFLESPEEEGRLDYVIFTQNPETGEYLSWNATVEPGLGSWFRQELALYAWYAVL